MSFCLVSNLRVGMGRQVSIKSGLLLDVILEAGDGKDDLKLVVAKTFDCESGLNTSDNPLVREVHSI